MGVLSMLCIGTLASWAPEPLLLVKAATRLGMSWLFLGYSEPM